MTKGAAAAADPLNEKTYVVGVFMTMPIIARGVAPNVHVVGNAPGAICTALSKTTVTSLVPCVALNTFAFGGGGRLFLLLCPTLRLRLCVPLTMIEASPFIND